MTTPSKPHDRTATYSLFGRSYCYITCPYCSTQCKAFIWSLSGGGKRCPMCLRMHTNTGLTLDTQPPKRRKRVPDPDDP